MELKIHTTIEEEIFYPAVREALLKEVDLLDEAIVETRLREGVDLAD